MTSPIGLGPELESRKNKVTSWFPRAERFWQQFGTPGVAAAATKRWFALDLLKFLAVVLMVQGHLFTVVLDDAVRAEGWYTYHRYVHGFTAPIFFFTAGIAFGFTTLRRLEKHAVWNRVVAQRVRKYFVVIGIGYLLQLPQMSLWFAFYPRSLDEFQEITRSNALQCIGVTLILLQLAIPLARTRKRFVSLTWGALLLLSIAAPMVWRFPADVFFAAPIAAYINDSTGSIFPLFPWAGFIAAGVLAADWVTRDVDLPKNVGVRFAVVGLGILSLSWFLSDAGFNPFGEHNFWKTSPFFFGTRIGGVLLVFSAMCFLEPLGRTAGPAIRGMQIVGQETLVIYAAHLAILYGSPLWLGLKSVHSHDTGLWNASLYASLLLGSMTALAIVWHRLKVNHPVNFRWVIRGLWGGALYFLLLH
ncbi:MAG: heparan-alpha-glucosaminide N-acetyltransferase domain-containing protein [Myxococcota bacterium]